MVSDYDADPEEVDVSSQADRKFIQIRWHFYDAMYDYWFAIDDIRVSGDRGPAPPPPRPTIGIEGNNVTLTWEIFGGGNYTVEYTEDLTRDDWQPAPGFAWPITETSWSGEDVTGIGGRFYRVNSQ